jgi:hypothetical protein
MTINLFDVIKHYKGLPHQLKAVQELERYLGPDGLSNDATWVSTWRNGPTQPDIHNNTWEGIKAAAATAGAKFPEVVAAQWALESAFGTVTSGKNNYFGIKGHGTIKTTWEDYGYGPVTIQASFKDYPTPYDCIKELVDHWYKDFKTYTGVNRAKTRNECAYLLKSEGYATDPDYSHKLIKLMDQYG